MKAPDKIYLHPDIGDREFIRSWAIRAVTTDAVCYINKEALLEWAEQNKTQAQMWFDRYNDREDLSAKQVWEEVIDKLNEM